MVATLIHSINKTVLISDNKIHSTFELINLKNTKYRGKKNNTSNPDDQRERERCTSCFTLLLELCVCMFMVIEMV